MNSAIEKLDVEINRLTAEVRIVEAAPPTIAERYADAEAQLRDAEQLYRTHGLRISAAHPAETAFLARQSLIGALMVANSAALLKVERQRAEAGGEGLSAVDRARRLEQLHRQILQTAARRELLVRDLEGDGFMVRPVHAELVVYRRGEVERIAATR